MLMSLSLILLCGLACGALCRRVRLPALVGMLAAGILLGPHALNLLDENALRISADVRKMALVVILLRAGLSLKLSDLKKVGRPAVLMAFVPATFEIAAFTLLAPPLLGLTRVEAAVMGAVMGAVSPAVVVPRMVRLMDERLGTDKGVPQLIMAGASCDDVYVIVLFTAFMGMAQGGGVRAADFAGIPIAIVLGVLVGMAAGWGLSRFFATLEGHGARVRGTQKAVVLLALAFLLTAAEDALETVVPFSGLLAVMAMGCVYARQSAPACVAALSAKYEKLWLVAGIFLFVLVGAEVDVRYALEAGPAALALIALALCVRSVGVLCCLARTPFNARERLFCVLSYLPKATVQAAIGGLPLALGLSCGNIVLAVAVLGILITAPLGALAMDATATRLLAPAAKGKTEDR